MTDIVYCRYRKKDSIKQSITPLSDFHAFFSWRLYFQSILLCDIRDSQNTASIDKFYSYLNNKANSHYTYHASFNDIINTNYMDGYSMKVDYLLCQTI